MAFQSDMRLKVIKGSLCLLIAVWTVGCFAPVANSQRTTQSDQFCAANPVRDYERPLVGLAENPLPEVLPFSPAGLEARTLRLVGDRLVYQGTPPLMGIVNPSAGVVDVGWVVVTRTIPVETGEASETRTEISSLKPREFRGFGGPVLGQPGTVRLEVEFLGPSGERLGLYSEYLQVVPWTLEVRLGVSRSVVSPGEGLSFRLENPGTAQIRYGLDYRIERRYKGRWIRVFEPGAVLSVSYGLRPGQGGLCGRARIKDDAAPGRYRVKKEFSLFEDQLRRRYAVKTFWVRRGNP